MDFRLPELGEGVYEAELVEWLVHPGDTVKHGDNVAEVLTDKASMELPAPFSGTIGELIAEQGQQIKVGDVVLTYEATDAKQPAATSQRRARAAKQPRKAAAAHVGGNGEHDAEVPHPHVATAAERVRAAPSVRVKARQMGVDLTQVHGTGPGGRILAKDLTGHVETAAAKKPTRARAAASRQAEFKPGTRVKLAGLRRKIAEHTMLAKRTVPHYGYVDECDVTELVRLRASVKEKFADAEVKLTYLAFFVKAAVEALKEFPIVNSSLDEETGEIVLHDHYHIGIAASTPAGLIVPVIRDADRKDLTQIAREIDRLSRDARSGKSRLQDLRGSTFTITSIGGIGGVISTPILNYPEVGIMGIGKIVKRPIYDADGNLHPADMVYLSFSFDHRVLDGATGAQFGNAIIRHLQHPATLLLPVTI
jgi:2-oxoisovalerate dehydrogenase E2 component (dihydrolipoyl transacylase)